MNFLRDKLGKLIAYCVGLKKPIPFWIAVISGLGSFVVCGIMAALSIVLESSRMVGLAVVVLKIFVPISFASAILYYISQLSNNDD